MSFAIFISKTGAARIEMMVEPTETIRAVRDRAGLSDHRLRRSATNLAPDKTLEQLGVVAGDRLLAAPNVSNPQAQARRRLERQVTTRSTLYPQLVQTVRADGSSTRTLVKSEAQETRNALTPIAKDAKEGCVAAVAVHDMFLGKEVPRSEGQTDAERMKQLRLLTCSITTRSGI